MSAVEIEGLTETQAPRMAFINTFIAETNDMSPSIEKIRRGPKYWHAAQANSVLRRPAER